MNAGVDPFASSASFTANRYENRRGTIDSKRGGSDAKHESKHGLDGVNVVWFEDEGVGGRGVFEGEGVGVRVLKDEGVGGRGLFTDNPLDLRAVESGCGSAGSIAERTSVDVDSHGLHLKRSAVDTGPRDDESVDNADARIWT